MRSGFQRGFSLLELCVCIAIAGILLALTLSAVQYAREAARRSQCQSNLRGLAMALQHHHDARGAFPAGKWTDKVSNRNKHAFWTVQLLPFLDQKQVYSKARSEFEKQADALHPKMHSLAEDPVSAFACPSDGRVPGPQTTNGKRVVALTSYVGCLGLDHEWKNGVLFADSQMTLGAITDGASNTIVIGERPPSTDFWYGWWYAGYGQNGEGSPDGLLGAAELNYSAHYLENCGLGPHTFSSGNLNEMCDALHYWSLHPGGANFAFADGSVRLLTYDAAEILPKLATRAGGETVSVP